MKIEIPKITLDAFKIFGNENLEAELDRQEHAVKSAWWAYITPLRTEGIK